MQVDKQNFDSPKEPGKHSQSIPRYPQNGPTYVVAFSMHETYDDLMTAQQMICKKSPQGSINSVTPTSSLKVLDPNSIEKCSHIIDMPDDNIPNQPNEANKCFEVEKIPETETNVLKIENNSDTEIVQPEVIFNATHTKQIRNDHKLRKKPRKNKHVAKIRNEHFKCKRSHKNITKRLELYCTKSKRHAMATNVIEKGLCNLSNVVTQSRVLKKVIAVENLLGVNSPEIDIASNDGLSSLSSSTTKKGILSHSSDNTITRKWSLTSSKTDDCSSNNTDSSVIQISSENVIPYKTDIINVAVAVTFNKNKANERKLTTKQFITRNEDNYLTNEDLTTTETVIIPQDTLTSKKPSYAPDNLKNARTAHLNYIKDASSDITLIGNRRKSSLVMSIDEDTFLIARTRSDFNKSSLSSNLRLTNSETQSDNTIHGHEDIMRRSEYNNRKLLDTVINLGFFPEATPSTSKFNANNVIITKEHKTYAKKEDETIHTDRTDLTKNILTKTFACVKDIGPQKIINLPDESAIRAKLKENEEIQHKVNIEYQNPQPSTLTEMWDKLIAFIDAGLKRIEETLPEKIIKEFKRFFDFDEYKNFIYNIISDKKDNDAEGKENITSTKGICVNVVKTEMDQGVQCDLVQNQVIDQLMTKLHPEGTSDVTGKMSKKLFAKIIKEYFEVTPAAGSDFELKEDVTISGIEPELAQNMERFHRLKILMTVPVKFVKENAFVMTSVPAFFILLLSMYGLVIFIMKPL